MAPRMTKSKMYSYMRNVGRSFGYAMVDSVKSMNPTVTALFKTTAEQSRDLYQSVKNFDAKSLGFEDSDLKGTLGQAVKDLKNNALDDIRTGKWYNKDRMNKYETEMAEDMFGINFDDFGDFDDFNFEDTELDEEASITEDATKATVKAMDTVGGKVSTAVSTAAIKSADYIVESSRINTKAIYGLTQAGFSQVNKGVATMNGNLQLLVSLAEPITTHIQNSALFYTKSQEYQNKSLELLKQIAANTSPKSSNNFKTSGRGKSYTDFITSEGVIDIAALFENGTKRMKENTEMITSMLSFVPGGEKAILKMATASPLQFALTSAISGLFSIEDRQGNSIKKSFENFNKVLADFSLGLLGRAKKATFGDSIFSPFLRGIRDFLLPSDGKIQKKANSGAYEKGKVDWDGISRRALTEVIPKQLGQILAILENNFGPAGDYKVYDYDKGQFKKASSIRASYMADRRKYAQSAGGDLFRDVRNSLQYSGMNKNTQKNYNQQIDALLDYMMVTGNYDILSGNFDFKKAGMSSSVAADLQKRIRAIQNSKGGQAKLSGLVGNVYGARNRFDARNRNANGLENILVDGSYRDAGRKILNGSDEYGLTQSEYLRRILGHVSYISKNLKNLVGMPGVGGVSQDGSQIVWEEGDWITKSSDKNTKPSSKADRIKPFELNRNYNVEDAVNRATGIKSSPYTDAEEKVLAKYGGDPEKIPDDEPLKDAILRKFNFEQMKGAASSFASGAYGRLKGGKLGGAIGRVENYLGTSTEEVTAALDKVSGALNDFVYDNKTGIYALMNTMTAGVLDMVKGLIPKEVRDLISAGWKKLKESKFGKATGQTLKNIAFSFFGKKREEQQYDASNDATAMDTFRNLAEDLDIDVEVPGAHGSGLISRINRATSRIYSNQRAGGNFWGNYSRSVSSSPRTGYAGGRSRARRRFVRTRRFSGGATGTTDEAAGEPPEGEVSDEAVESLFHRIASKVSSSIINKISDVIGKNDPEKEKKDVKGTIEKLMKEAGLAKGAIGAGAVLGGGASLLTGAFLGPIAGAAIGAAAGFVSKSETAQKFLFGEWDDKKGEYTGNSLLPKEVGKFFKQNGAATGKGAGAGMLLGTFMGSPVLGAILGASAGYISSSEKAKKFIFGDMEKEEEGLIPLSLQKTLKEKFPFFAGGIGAALLFAPGPLIPKIAIGATIGAIVGNDKGEGIKKWFFGEKDKDGKRKGGFLGYMNDNLFKPMLGTIDKTFNMLTKGLKDTITQGTRKLFGALKTFLEKEGGPVGRGIVNLGGKIANLGGNLAKGAVSLVGSPFRAANRALEKKALKSGYAFRGEDNEYLSSAERLKLAAEKGYKYRETGSTLVDQYLKNLSPEEYDQFLADMEAAEKGEDAGNARISQILAGSHTTKLKYKDITHAIQQVKIDKDKYNKNKEAQEKLKEDPTYNITNRIPTLIESVVSAIYGIDNTLRHKFGMEPITVPAGNVNPTENKVDNTEDVMNENGEYSNASNTGRRKFNEKKSFLESVGSLPIIGVGVTKIIDIMTSIKKSIIGDGDKKPGLFDRIKEALISEKGLLGGILGFFTGSTAIGGTVGKLLSKFSLSNILPMAAKGVGLFALYKALIGDFDSTFSMLSNLPLFRGNDTTEPFGNNKSSEATMNKGAQSPAVKTITTKDGKTKTVYRDIDNDRVRVGENNTLSARLKKNILSGGLLGRSSVGTAVVKATTGLDLTTKGAAKALSSVGKNGLNVASGGMVNSIMTSIATALEKIPAVLKAIPFIPSNVANGADEIVTTLYTHLDDAVKNIAKSPKIMAIASTLSKALVVLQIGYVVGKGINAWGNAESILGITEQATTGQRIIAVLISVVNALIPVIGDLIPEKVLVNIFMSIAPKIGIDVSSLQEQRDRANAEVQAYIDATGDTSMSIEKYNQLGLTQNEDGTFTQGKARAGIITRAKMKVGGFIDNVKDQGFGNAVKETFGNVGTKISGAAGKVADSTKKIFDVVKGQTFDAVSDAIDNRSLSDMFKVEGLPEDSPLSGFAKAAIIAGRVVMAPKILVGKMAYSVGSAFANFAKKIHDAIQHQEELNKQERDKADAILSGDGTVGEKIGAFFTDIKVPEGVFPGLFKAITIARRTISLPSILVSHVGKSIGEWFTNTANHIKDRIETFTTAEKGLTEYVKSGDVVGLAKQDLTERFVEGNPVGGFLGGIYNASKSVMYIPTAVSWVGHFIGDHIGATVDEIKDSYGTLDNSFKGMKEYAGQGEVAKIRNMQYPNNKTGLIPIISKAIFSGGKIFYSIIGMINKLMAPIKETVASVENWVGDKAEGISTWWGGVKEYWSNFGQTVKNTVTSGEASGSGSGVVSQLDPKYNRYSVGGKSFAANGCGPASAVMAAGGRLSDAVNIAQKYQTVGGTDAAYFGEMFNRRGMNAHYYLAGGSSLIGDIAAGKPTVLMGRDIYNTSKANSPFGPNNHYVVANGFDGSGNLLISDPEQRGVRRYSPSILRNVRVGVSGGGPANAPATTSSTASAVAASKQGATTSGTTSGNTYRTFGGVTMNTSTGTVTSTKGYGSWTASKAAANKDLTTDSLRSEKFGSSTGTTDSGNYGSTDVSSYGPGDQRAAYVYALINKRGGYAPGAICGILANLQAESGMDPTALQKTKSGIHHAAGIAQWENYAQQSGRWLNLKKYADSKGVDWTDLDTQIEFLLDEVDGLGSYFRSNCGISVADFKKQTDPKKATLQFQKAFERGDPEKAHMNTRYQYAEDFFRKFSGLSASEIEEILANGAFGNGDIGNDSDSKAATDKKNNKGKVSIGGIISTITSAFSNAFSKLFNGTSEDEEEGIEHGGSNGTFGTSDVSGTDPVSYMESVKNKIQYTFGAKDPEGGKADCSGTVNWAVKKASGIDLGGSTLSMYNSKNLRPVWYNNGATSSTIPAGAKRNDILLFSRPNSSYTQGRPDRVGHVGIYTGEGNKFIEIGKGTGTYESNLTSGSNLIKVGRLIDDNGNEINFLGDGETTDPVVGEAEVRKDYGNAKVQAKAEQTAAKSARNVSLRGEAARGSGLLYYGPSKAGQYILRDNSRNYYRQGGGASGTVNRVSGGSLLEAARGAINRTASSAKQSAKDLGALPANVSAIKQDTNDMNATLKEIAGQLKTLIDNGALGSASGSGMNSGGVRKGKPSSTGSNNMNDYSADAELQSIMESIITSAI